MTATESSTVARTPRAASRAPARTWGERILLTLGSVATAFSLIAAGVLAWGLEQFNDIATVDIANVAQAPPGEPANWLLVGTDSRDEIDPNDPNAGIFVGGPDVPTGKRTDTMIIARVDPEQKTIDLLSIPRDLYVPIAGTSSESRINSAFNAENGEARLVDTIEAFLGVEINHYAEVNFVGFQDVVDELGGVPMWFDRPMRDAGSGLSVQNAGCVNLDGFQALAFARSRNLEYFEDGAWRTDPTGDLGRTSRQQYFLRRVVDTAAQQVDLTSLGKVNSLLSVGGSNLVIDDGVEPGDLLGLAQTFADAGSERIAGHALPVADFRSPDGAAVLQLQFAEAQPTLDIFRGLAASSAGTTTTTAAPLPLEASVFNGSGVAGQAGQVATVLEAAGFTIVGLENAEPRESTLLRYAPGQEQVAAELISLLARDPQIEIAPDVASPMLITGSDFNGTAAERRPITELSAPAEEAPTTTVPAEGEPATTPTTEAVGVVPEPTPVGTACG